MNKAEYTEAGTLQFATHTTPPFAIPAEVGLVPGTEKAENLIKPKRKSYPFVQHAKTPYLARRGKPNPNGKKDGAPGTPIPFGSWYVYQTIDGVDYRFSLETEVYVEAKGKYANWRETLNKVTTTAGSLSSLLQDILNRRKATCKGRQSVVTVTNSAKRLLRGCPFMTTDWAALDNSTILTEWSTYVDSGHQTYDDGTTICRHYALNTLNLDYKLLRSLIKLAVKKHCIPDDHDLLLDVRAPDPDNTCPKRVSELSRDMFQSIRWHMYNGNGNTHPHTPIIFDVYWMSGGRKNSVYNIHTEDVNFATGILFFRVAKGRPKGYSVPMSIDLQLLLKEHIEKYNKKHGEQIFNVFDINESIRRACVKAGWHLMHAHDFRHLFACHALERTKNIALVAKWLGHQDGGILAARVYATTSDEDSNRHMREDMVFVSQQWSPDGFSLMRTKIQSKLTDIALQVGTSSTQADIEKLLFGLREVVENPLSATEMDPNHVLAKGSVIPIGLKNVVMNRMVDWIQLNPGIPSSLAMDVLKAKFPDSTPSIRRRALSRTEIIRKQANKVANADLHTRMVAYLKAHPGRYRVWLLCDFPEASLCSADRAILSVYGSFKQGHDSRDNSCSSTMKELLKDRKEKQIAAVMAKLVATEVPG